MRTPRSFLAFFASLFLLAPSIGHSQSMCAPVSNNPLVMANLCSPEPAIERTSPTGPARPPLTLTVEQVDKMVLDSSPFIHPGDFLLFETNRRDFVLHLLLSNGKEIVTQPLTREDAEDTSIAWRQGRIRLDYPEALNQRIVRYRLVPLHAGGTPLLIRGIKVDGRGKLIFELEKSDPGAPKQAPIEPPMSYPPDPHVMTASASRPDIWGRQPEPGFLAPHLPSFSIHPMMFQSTSGTGDPNHFKWNGKELDAETGLYNFGARYYSPALGRFVTPDPKVISKQRMADPQQWNMYSYSRNNPTSMFDPDGKEVRMAPNQSAEDIAAMVRTLAHSYQKQSFRQKFDQLSQSKHTFYLEKTNIPQPPQVSGSMVQTVTPGQNKVEPLDPSKPISADNFKDTIQFDSDKFFGSVSAGYQDFIDGHEFFHGVNIDNDVAGMQSKSEGADPQEEKNANDFGDKVEGEKPSMSLDKATKAVNNALGLDKSQKPDKKDPQ